MKAPFISDTGVASVTVVSALLSIAALGSGLWAFGVVSLIAFIVACGIGFVRSVQRVSAREEPTVEEDLLCAMEQAMTALREDDPAAAFDILSAHTARAYGEDSFQDLAGTEWPIGKCPSCRGGREAAEEPS